MPGPGEWGESGETPESRREQAAGAHLSALGRRRRCLARARVALYAAPADNHGNQTGAI